MRDEERLSKPGAPKGRPETSPIYVLGDWHHEQDIGVFDHRAHVAAHPEGKIAPEIMGSKHVLFCLSDAIPNPLIAAVRPRALSVVELEGKFVISFLEAPVEGPNKVMAGWIEGLHKG